MSQNLKSDITASGLPGIPGRKEVACQNMEYDEEALHEECGVFGAYDLAGHDVAKTIYYGLLSLQHRGQESCGIAV